MVVRLDDAEVLVMSAWSSGVQVRWSGTGARQRQTVHGGRRLGPDAMVLLQWSIDGADGLVGCGSVSQFFLWCRCAPVVC